MWNYIKRLFSQKSQSERKLDNANNNVPFWMKERDQEILLAWADGVNNVGYGDVETVISHHVSVAHNEIVQIVSNSFGGKFQIRDLSKIDKSQDRVFEKYAKEDEKFGGVGGGGELLEGFYQAFNVILHISSPWVISHIIKDLDDGAWNFVKKTAFSLLKLVTRQRKEGNIIIITSSHVDNENVPTIVFVIPSRADLNKVNSHLDEILTLTKASYFEYLEKLETRNYIFEYTFDTVRNEWKLKKFNHCE